MNTTIGFATIGTSKITRKFLSAAKECAGFKLAAVYSRDIKRQNNLPGSRERSGFMTVWTCLWQIRMWRRFMLPAPIICIINM